MNFFGKTLIVLQLFLSLLFLCFAGAVYHFQGEWQKKANGLQADVQKKDSDLAKLNTDIQAERLQLNAEAENLKTRLATTEIERDQAVQARNASEATLSEVRQERDKALAENERATNEAISRFNDSLAANTQLTTMRVANAEQMKRIQVSENENLDNSTALAAAREREKAHVRDIGRLRDLLRARGVDPSSPVPDYVPTIAERVEGKVEARKENEARTQEYVQVSIGSDDGIEENMILIATRGDDFVCDIRVFKVFPDRAIGIVIEKTRRSNVQEGDNVTTKL